MHRSLRLALAVITALSLTTLPAVADPPTLKSAAPSQGWVDEETAVVVTGGSLDVDARAALLTRPPAVLWTMSFPEDLVDVAVGASVAYVLEGGAGFLTIIDLRDPEYPVQTARVPAPGGMRIAVDEAYAHVATQDDASSVAHLLIFDVTDPLAPVLLETSPFPEPSAGGVSTGFVCRSLVARDGYVYVSGADGELGGLDFPALPWLWAVDARDPMQPTWHARLDLPGFVWFPHESGGMSVANDHLFVTTAADFYHDDVHVLDLSDPASPALVRGFRLDYGSSPAIDASGDLLLAALLCVGDCEGGYEVVDISDPAAPVSLRRQRVGYGWSYAIAAGGGVAYLLGPNSRSWDTGLHDVLAVDVSDPGQPAPEGGLQTLPFLGEFVFGENLAGEITVIDDLLLAAGPKTLALLDLRNEPLRPWIAGELDSAATGVSSRSTFAYLADRDGLQIVNASDPQNPRLEGRLDLDGPSRTRDLDVRGDYAHVVNDSHVLHVVDVSDASAPSVAGRCELGPYSAGEVAATDDYAYAIAEYAGPLVVCDVRDPAAPRFWYASTYDNDYRGVAASGNVAYVIGWDFGDPWRLDVFEVINPPRGPKARRVGMYTRPGSAGEEPRGIAYSSGHVYVAGRLGTVHVLDVRVSASPELVGSFEFGDQSTRYLDLTIEDGRAYLRGERDITVLDLRDPRRPTLVGRYEVIGHGRLDAGPSVSDGMAYVLERGSLQVVSLNPPLVDHVTSPPSAIRFTVPPGYSPGPYHSRVANDEPEASLLHNAFRACLRREFSFTLEPVLPAVAGTDPRAWRASLTDPPRWRLELAGDEALFTGRGRHEAAIALPELPETWETTFQLSDEPGRTTIDLYLAPESDAGVVLLTGPDEDDARALWDAMHVNLACALPHRNETTYGDIKLAVFPNERVRLPKDEPLGRAPGGLARGTGPLTLFRYELVDGQLDAAYAFGPGADLVMQATGWDEYRCEYVDEESFSEMLRERCAELTPRDPRLARHCAF